MTTSTIGQLPNVTTPTLADLDEIEQGAASYNMSRQQLLELIAANMALKGIASARPSANIAGRLYYATDTQVFSRDNGTSWDAITIPVSGAAGGVLAGTYPNPSFAVDMATQAELDAAQALDLKIASNLSDLQSVSSARTSLGLGTAAVTNTGTGATNTILGNDARLTDSRTPTTHAHPESDVTSLVADLALKAPLANPTFTGTAAAPTAAADDSTTKIATTAYVQGQKGTANPQAPGTAAAGTSAKWTPIDHVHPVIGSPAQIGVAVSDETTVITTGTGKLTFRMPYAMTLTSVRASLKTASSSGIPAINIKENGTTIFSTTLTIDATEKTSTTAAVPAVISDANLADDSEITVDIDTAGTGAVGLKLWLIGARA